MKKTKLLHIITRLDKGGSSENTILTVRGLSKDIYDVTLLSGSTKDPDRMVVDLTKENIRQVYIDKLVRPISPLKDFIALIKLYRFMQKEKFDILHTHSSKAGILGRWAAKFANVPILIHTPHGHIFYGYFGKFKTWFFTLLERITANFTDKIIGLTPTEVKEHIERKIGTNAKFVSIPSGVELEKYLKFSIDVEEEKKKLGLPRFSRVVGTIARLDPVKGVRYLLEAHSIVMKEFPDSWLIIVGDGPQERELRDIAEKLRISEHTMFLRPMEDVRPILAAFDIFVLPSLNEGMGRVLVEAMAMGKPVVGSDVCGIKDILASGCGILVEPKNPNAIAKAVEMLFHDEDLARKMALRAKESLWPKYDAKTMVNAIDELYRQLTKAK